LIQIDKWHHKEYSISKDYGAFGQKPSSYETFQMIAKILVTKDTTLWKPTLPANNHWSNWKDGGTF
jgi:hypothetical protein